MEDLILDLMVTKELTETVYYNYEFVFESPVALALTSLLAGNRVPAANAVLLYPVIMVVFEQRLT